jgi:hypothetical protein
MLASAARSCIALGYLEERARAVNGATEAVSDQLSAIGWIAA